MRFFAGGSTVCDDDLRLVDIRPEGETGGASSSSRALFWVGSIDVASSCLDGRTSVIVQCDAEILTLMLS